MRRNAALDDALYTIFRHDPESPFACFYCGESASTLDHQPPVSRIYDYRAMGLRHECYVKVPACEECNNLLGATLTLDLLEREMVLRRKLEERYRRALEMPPWARGELRQLRGRLRQHVENHQRRRDWIQRRLDYSRGINAFLETVELGDGPVRVVSW